MPPSTFPYVVGASILRTCRQGKHRVAAPSMCRTHPHTCLTCCSSHLKRPCGLSPRDVPAEKYFPNMTWDERQTEMAQLRRQLGFRPETDAEIAENIAWRTT